MTYAHSWRAAVLLAAALLPGTMHAPASASGCVHPKTVPIQFARSARCWIYHGDATEVRGTFRRGQAIVASSAGEQSYGDGRWEWKAIEARELHVVGPGDQPIEIGEDHSFVAPLTGTYSFSFGPCSAWRGVGTFIICAR